MNENISDHELLTILQTDPDNAEMALTEIWNRYYNSLCVLAYRLVGDRDDARDIVSEVFAQLWSKRDTDQLNIVKLKPYLIVSAYNNAYGWKRSVKRRMERDQKWTEQHKISSSFEADHSIIQTEYYQTLYKALDSLPPRTREVFLEYLKGNNTQKISKLFGIDQQTVRNHKAKAMQKLISLLDGNPHLILLLAIVELF